MSSASMTAKITVVRITERAKLRLTTGETVGWILCPIFLPNQLPTVNENMARGLRIWLHALARGGEAAQRRALLDVDGLRQFARSAPSCARLAIATRTFCDNCSFALRKQGVQSLFALLRVCRPRDGLVQGQAHARRLRWFHGEAYVRKNFCRP